MRTDNGIVVDNHPRVHDDIVADFDPVRNNRTGKNRDAGTRSRRRRNISLRSNNRCEFSSSRGEFLKGGLPVLIYTNCKLI